MLLQQYLVELMDSGQHSLMPVYACHLRADERREVSTIPLLRRPDEIVSASKSGLCPHITLCVLDITPAYVEGLSITRQQAS